MKKIGFIFVAVLFFMVNGTAIGGSPITYSEPTTFSCCEFRVFFPTKTKQISAFANGIESLIVQSVYDGKSPFMRAECLPLSNPNETIAAFRSILENQARNAGVQNPEITIEKSKLGIIGTYTGVRKAGGFDIKIFGKLVIGNISILSLLISEEVTKFPSDKAVYFLNTVERK
jgi:hypothetical protein